jgi:hypothetical protein
MPPADATPRAGVQGEDERPYRCGAFVTSPPYEQCILESDHAGPHRLASDPAPAPAALPGDWAQRIAALERCVSCWEMPLTPADRTTLLACAALADLPALVADAARWRVIAEQAVVATDEDGGVHLTVFLAESAAGLEWLTDHELGVLDGEAQCDPYLAGPAVLARAVDALAAPTPAREAAPDDDLPPDPATMPDVVLADALGQVADRFGGRNWEVSVCEEAARRLRGPREPAPEAAGTTEEIPRQMIDDALVYDYDDAANVMEFIQNYGRTPSAVLQAALRAAGDRIAQLRQRAETAERRAASYEASWAAAVARFARAEESLRRIAAAAGGATDHPDSVIAWMREQGSRLRAADRERDLLAETARWLTDERDRLARALDDQHAATDGLHNERSALTDRLRAAEAALREIMGARRIVDPDSDAEEWAESVVVTHGSALPFGRAPALLPVHPRGAGLRGGRRAPADPAPAAAERACGLPQLALGAHAADQHLGRRVGGPHVVQLLRDPLADLLAQPVAGLALVLREVGQRARPQRVVGRVQHGQVGRAVALGVVEPEHRFRLGHDSALPAAMVPAGERGLQIMQHLGHRLARQGRHDGALVVGPEEEAVSPIAHVPRDWFIVLALGLGRTLERGRRQGAHEARHDCRILDHGSALPGAQAAAVSVDHDAAVALVRRAQLVQRPRRAAPVAADRHLTELGAVWRLRPGADAPHPRLLLRGYVDLRTAARRSRRRLPRHDVRVRAVPGRVPLATADAR